MTTTNKIYDWWLANGGKVKFITATEEEIEEMDNEEYGVLDSFQDERMDDEKNEIVFCCHKCEKPLGQTT